MNNLPWNKFELATENNTTLNISIGKQIDIYVTKNPDSWPTNLKIGKELLNNCDNYWNQTDKYWGGYVGLLKMEIIPGQEILIEGKKL